jgi:hypothetical protein
MVVVLEEEWIASRGYISQDTCQIEKTQRVLAVDQEKYVYQMVSVLQQCSL